MKSNHMHTYKKIALLSLVVLSFMRSQAQTYTPSAHVQVNDAVAPAQATPLEARSMFFDASNFLYRAFQSTSEVLSYLNTTASRTGNFIIIVDSGGTLQGNGTYLNPHNTYYMFADSTTAGQLKKMNLFGTGNGSCSSCLQVANNLSDLASLSQALINLNLNNVNNTSDATKNAATVTLTNHSISGSANTLTNIPNSALVNTTVGLTLNSAGTVPQVTTTPAALGNSLVLSVPISNGTNTGFLNSTNWSFFNGKLDSIHISNDSIFNCVNGTCTLQSVVSAFGPVNAVNPANASLIFSPTTGFVLGQVNPAYDFFWSGQHTFTGFAPIFSSLTANGGVFYGNTFGQLLQTTGGTTGQLLQSNGGAPPTFFTVNAATVDGWLGYTPLTAALPSTQIFVGNVSGVATPVVASGDWTISNTGVATLKNTGPGAGSCIVCDLTLDAQGRVTAYAPGAVNSFVAGFGILKFGDTALIDTTLSYFPYHVVTGLNDKNVSSGNSNSVGFNNPPGSGTNLPNSYPARADSLLGGTSAGWTLDVLGIPSQTTTQMITGDPTRVDTAYDASKSVNYLPAWEMENDIQINAISAFEAVTHMNTYYTDRNLVGWRTIGATALTKTNGSDFDSLLTATIDSANNYLITNHTSDLFIDFTHNPWLNNNMSRAGFGPDFIHMNASGTQEEADSFALVIKRDLGQPAIPVPARPVFWGGNVVDRNMVIGPLNGGYGVSLLANGMAAFDVTGSGGIAYVGQKNAELPDVPNIGFDLRPSFWNPQGYTGTTNYDLRLNTESQWIDMAGNKIALFNPAGSIMNIGLGIDIFANLQPGQSTYYFNSAFGTHAFQGATPGLFNTRIGSFSSDISTANGNVLTVAGLAVPAIGNNNTWNGANGSIAGSITGSTTLGYGNTQGANYGIAVGNSNNISGTSTHTGGTIAIGYNQNDNGFRSILIGNLESAAYGNLPTADGQCIIGDIYNGSGYKAINSFFFGGNQALNSGIQAAFAGITMNVPSVAPGSSNTNLSASAEFWQFNGALATGNALSGDIIFATGQKTTSGTAGQTPVKMLRIAGDQTVDIGEPATHPYGTNINTSVGINKDSVPLITPVSTTQVLVIDAVSQKVNRIVRGGVLASNDLTAQSAAVATVTSYAVPGSGSFNTFRVGGYLTVTAVSLDVIQLQVTYTDETSTSRTQSFFVQGTTTGISVTGANGYSPIDIRVKQGTTITVSTILTTGAGSITYDVGASITQLY
jgi:hypothetical protein